MRMIMTVNIPVEKGNEGIISGKMGEFMESTLGNLNPEAAYFTSIEGERTGIIVFDMKDPSEIPLIAEPWFLAFNAKVDFRPAMVLEDFKKAAGSLPEVVEKYS